MDGDLISRKALLDQFSDLKAKAETLRDQLYLDGVMAVIDVQPKMNAEPVIHAYWIQHENAGPMKSECSACRTTFNIRIEYDGITLCRCPKCGVRMDADAPERGEGSGNAAR